MTEKLKEALKDVQHRDLFRKLDNVASGDTIDAETYRKRSDALQQKQYKDWLKSELSKKIKTAPKD